MRITLLALPLVACSGGSASGPQVTLDPVPDKVTVGVLSGPLCSDQACQCRDVSAPADGGAGVPDVGDRKRFELRVGPSEHELWVKLDDMIFYKSDERATDCFYVDLAPGDHRVTLRAKNVGGFSAQLDISEYGTATQSWYRTYHFDCGAGGGVCDHDDMDAYKASLAKYPRNLQDPCGSTKAKAISWDTGRAPDFTHPEDLQLQLTLQVYDFAPKHPHGHAECADRYAE